VAKTVVITDDLDGSSPAETVRFGLNDTWFEIDLSQKSYKKLEDALKPFLDKARRPEGARSSRTRTPRSEGAAKKTVEWGMPHRGRVSPEEAAYVRDHFDEIQKLRSERSVPLLDPADPKTKERYGL
jgi:Lsr2